MSMKINYRLTEKAKILAQEMMSEKDESLSSRENLIESYRKRMPEVETPEDAVDEVLKGCTAFADEMEGNSKKDSEESADPLEAYNRAVRQLNLILEAADRNGLPHCDPLAEKTEGEVSEEELSRVNAALEEAKEEFGALLLEDEETAAVFSALEEEGIGPADEADLDDEFTYYLALAAYILHQQGEFAKYVPLETTAYSIGAMIAAGVAAAKAKLSGLAKKIPWQKVLSVLGKIASALLTVLMGAGVVYLGLLFLSSGVISFFVHVALVVCVISYAKDAREWIRSGAAAEWLEHAWETAKEKAAAAAEAVKNGLETAKSWLECFVSWLKEKAAKLWAAFSEKVNNTFEQESEELDAELDDEDWEEEEEEAPVFA